MVLSLLSYNTPVIQHYAVSSFHISHAVNLCCMDDIGSSQWAGYLLSCIVYLDNVNSVHIVDTTYDQCSSTNKKQNSLLSNRSKYSIKYSMKYSMKYSIISV